jgi:5' nucleotidase, deoxy (Pyrimidine), cytosolic type C protein (NT5C)
MADPKLFLDCDGVLADFEAGAREVLGGLTPAEFEERYSKREFWRRLASAPEFYNMLPLMPDARILFEAVAHLRPTILTGLPIGNWAAPQKVAWAERHFPDTPIITCMARDKYRYMTAGDVLVDDREDHRTKWEDAGGIFVTHKNAERSLAALRTIFPSIEG